MMGDIANTISVTQNDPDDYDDEDSLSFFSTLIEYFQNFYANNAKRLNSLTKKLFVQ